MLNISRNLSITVLRVKDRMVVGDRMVVRQSVVYPSDGTAVRELRPLPLPSIVMEDCTAFSPAQEKIRIQYLHHHKVKKIIS